MPVLGHAIARYLSSLRGLYSVELPESLGAEMVALVQHANALSPSRAFLVASSPPQPGLENATIGWRQILAWRTDEDRVFVWHRGLHEPDSSFLSVVRPFISRRFPGTGGGECDLPLLVRTCVRELWERRTWLPNGDAYEAFLGTFTWVADLFCGMFESAGNTPGMHWSDRFLAHFAGMLNNLDAGLASYSGTLAPRHSWEVVRLSGLPLPSSLVKDANPFLEPPDSFPLSLVNKFCDLWSDITESFLLREGGVAEFLLALDHESVGPEKISPWRSLDWDPVQALPPDAPAPVVGAAVFAHPPSPTILSDDIPNTSAPTRPSWWGVTTDHLESARTRLRKSMPLAPDDNLPGFVALGQGTSAPFVLDTRTGTVSHAHTPTKWRVRVLLAGLGLRYKEDWKTLSVGEDEPTTASDGDAWVDPSSLKLEMRGGKFDQELASATAGDQLQVTFNLQVEYTATRDRQSADLEGSWGTERKLKVKLDVRLRHGNRWDSPRRVETEIKVVVPSPFGSTVLVFSANKLEAVGPDTEDSFTAVQASATSWMATTPTVLLDEDDRYSVGVYDGVLEPWVADFRDVGELEVAGQSFPAPTGGFFAPIEFDLDDGVVVSDAHPVHGGDVAVFHIKEQSKNISSGILSAVRGLPSGRRPPSATARGSVLGRYQDGVTPTLCSSAPAALDSLYQYVIAASEETIAWTSHSGGPDPVMVFRRPAGFVLPGVGNGPSPALIGTQEWSGFMAVIGQACGSLGLRPGSETTWLSGLDPSAVVASTVKDVLQAHRSLVGAAAGLGQADQFWASFPFSVVVVDGHQGANFGQVQAVFLSPLHPARLAWGFAVTAIARKSTVDNGLLGLLEGWNLPAVGVTLNPAGERRWLVAVPIDPGTEQDFIGWSALAVLGPSGTAELPVIGGGEPLPWGGRTGINARVVERAMRDYLAAHPHLNAFEVDVRSVGASPRSKEIDDTLLDLLGAAGLDELKTIGGGTTVWDSLDRHGNAPTRDMLFSKRRSQERERSFEWRVYPATHQPEEADVALVENATVHLAVTPGVAPGVLGVLPMRRFLPADLSGTQLDQNLLPADGEDLLGLASLLRVLEAPAGEDMLSIRANPQVHALGIGRGAQWEVLGTFNLDPSLLATLVAGVPATAGRRLLWEWRPSWMVTEKTTTDLARRPYYVIARVPASLTAALHARQAISSTNAGELLAVLGQRGIGLAALSAQGATQESAAAGFFYALQLLSSNKVENPFCALPAAQRPLIYGVLPFDPVEPILQGLAGRRLDLRADILALAVSRGDDGVLRLCLVPGEVKHYGMPSKPAKLPNPANPKQYETEGWQHARDQLTQAVGLLREIIAGIAATDNDGVALRYLKRLGLATLVDLAMSFSPARPSASQCSSILSDILGGPIDIGVGDPMLLWFSPGCISQTARACVLDPFPPRTIDSLQARELFVDPAAVPGLWWSGSPTQQAETEMRAEVDNVIRSCFSKCAAGSTRIPPNRDGLAGMLGLLVGTPFSPGVAPGPEYPAAGPKPSGQARKEQEPAGEQRREEAAPGGGSHDAVEPPAREVPAVPDDRKLEAAASPRPVHEEAPAIASASPSTAPAELIPSPTPAVLPRAVVGWSSLGARWTAMGRLSSGGELVALDLDHPKAVGIFGYMGSGKSYLLGTLIESALVQIPGINALAAPLAVVIFNYRRNASDRFELSSFSEPNTHPEDVERLAAEYHSGPLDIQNVHVLCLPGELRPGRKVEYGNLSASELFFDPSSLDVEDWELLMGEPGSEAVFARTIRNTLVDLRSTGDITLESLDHEVTARLTGQSRAAARLRFDFVRRYISGERGTKYGELLQPGRAIIVDLRQPLFNKDDALRFFLVCANQISRVQGRFNKLLVFDEAHEYMSEAFGERMESRIRLMRHEGTSYIFATQDVDSIPTGIGRFLTTRFVFNLGTRENVQDLEQAAPEFKGMRLLDMRPGHCLVQSNTSTQGLFTRPREVSVRPRVTRHGGTSRIFASENPNPGEGTTG